MIGVTAEVEGGKQHGARWEKKENTTEKPVGEWTHMRVICKAEGTPIEFRNITLTALDQPR